MIVKPIAKPATILNAPRVSTAVANTAITRKNVMMISAANASPTDDAGPTRRRAEVDGVDLGVVEHDAEQQRSDHRADELADHVDHGHREIDPARDKEPECDRRVEVPAGDVAGARLRRGRSLRPFASAMIRGGGIARQPRRRRPRRHRRRSARPRREPPRDRAGRRPLLHCGHLVSRAGRTRSPTRAYARSAKASARAVSPATTRMSPSWTTVSGVAYVKVPPAGLMQTTVIP